MKIQIKELKKWTIKNLKWIVLFVCTIGFLSFAEDVFNKEIMQTDIIGYSIISKYFISDFMTPIIKFITNLRRSNWHNNSNNNTNDCN